MYMQICKMCISGDTYRKIFSVILTWLWMKWTTYRKFTGNRIEAHMHGMLEIRGIRYIRFGVCMRGLRTFYLIFQCLFLAIGIIWLCVNVQLRVKYTLLRKTRTYLWAAGAYRRVAHHQCRLYQPPCWWHLHRHDRHRDCWSNALAALAVCPPRWTFFSVAAAVWGDGDVDVVVDFFRFVALQMDIGVAYSCACLDER